MTEWQRVWLERNKNKKVRDVTPSLRNMMCSGFVMV